MFFTFGFKTFKTFKEIDLNFPGTFCNQAFENKIYDVNCNFIK